ncbi:fibronectin type III domain-containing protein [Paracoccus marcusii]|uniref:fibronectin type III domain-containing protein n=1 Tax=Paracoccus marcusii TaxID=59779 RepID=UPI001111AE32|nr:LamG-like jellyroll fold domain-containing protein [Paracoccus marcusii]TNC05568.1 hypothetical protein FHD68_03665 [Paracoccus marcusii]
MANIIKTFVGGAGARPVTEIVLTATNDLTYEQGAGHVLILRNPTAASIDCVLRGADSTTVNFPGAPFISVAGGYSTPVPAGAVRAIPLDTVAAYLKGPVAVTGVGLVAVLMRAVNGRGARSIFNDPPAAVPGEVVVPTAPAAFATGDWSVATGPAPNRVVITVNNLPNDGGSPITALQYSNGGTWTNLSGTGVGQYVLDMPAAGTEYPIRIRTRNAIGISGPGVTKTATSGAADTSAQRVILVTDYAGDCDDAPAVLMACDAHERGDISLLGIVASSTVATSAPGVYGQLAAYNMTSIPVYAYQGAIGTYNNRISAPVRDRFGMAGQTRTAFPDDVTGLRTMLAAAPNASVKIIDVGAPISTSRLLDSPADAISPMTGRELVAAKVVGLWMMAGEFTSTRVEYNADRDVASTQNVYQTWPTPIYAHGAEVGGTVLTAPMADADPLIDPVKVAFDAFDAASPSSLQMYLGRRARWSWDPICVHHAIYGNQNLYNLAGANGTITVSGTGVTSWSATPAGNKSYVGKVASDATIAAAIQSIIDNTTVMQNLDASVPAQVAQPSVNGTTSTRAISWTAPANGGSPILSYTIRRNGVTAGTVAGNILSFTIENIPDGTHTVTVSATNQRGEGQQSTAREFTVEPAGAVTPTNVAWPLQEGSGVAISRTGTQADIVGPVWEASPARITFNGTSHYAFSPPPAVADRGTDYVLSALVRLTNVTGTRCILSRNGNVSATTRVFQFRSNGGALEFVSSTDAGASVVVSAPAGTVPINTWVLVSAYVTLTGVEMRVNGDDVATGAFPAENRSSVIDNVRYEWGCRVNSSNGSRTDFMAGSMAAVAIVNSATAQTLPAVEAELRAIATAKGITLP